MTTTQRDLRDYVNDQALKHDNLRDQIYGLYDLFCMEIEDECASVQHEADLCISDIQTLIKDYNNE